MDKSTRNNGGVNAADLETASLLPDRECHKCSSTTRNRTRHLFKTIVLVALAYICFLETNTRLVVQNHGTHIVHGELPYSPANEVVQYAPRRVWQEGDYSIYHKEPGPELDALWNDLLTGQNIRISRDEMQLQGENMTNRVRLTDGDFLGLMSVWHSLHCLNRLRKVIHMDYYKDVIPDYKSDTGTWTKEHSDHCLERLRDEIMCHPNIAVYIPEWDEKRLLPDHFRMISNANAMCVDWNALDQWARKRALKAGEYTLMPDPFAARYNGKE